MAILAHAADEPPVFWWTPGPPCNGCYVPFFVQGSHLPAIVSQAGGAGKQIVAKDVLDKAVKAYAEAHKGAEIKTIEVYVKPEENVAYYVVNGEGSDDYKVTL